MLINSRYYEPPLATVWKGREDGIEFERFFQFVRTENALNYTFTAASPETVILGFCSDEGIVRNQGRKGAAAGPLALRQQLAKLAWHRPTSFLDLGNIVCLDGQLEAAQAQFAMLIHTCQKAGRRTVAFGGGHEIAWGHFMGLTQTHPEIGIINIDAHFDLRPKTASYESTSGTPFRQISEYCAETSQPFHYLCLGIQPHANTRSLFESATRLNVTYMTAEQINQTPLSHQLDVINTFIAKKNALYLSICLDVFAESVAPGVSAPQGLGLFPEAVLPLLKYILQSGKVVGLDIAELSPALDRNEQTARLGAMIMAEVLNCI